MKLAESFGQSALAQFINSTAGRIVRIVAGLVLILVGFMQGGGAAGVILILAGLVALAAGAFNLCLMSALLGGPLSGALVGQSKPKA